MPDTSAPRVDVRPVADDEWDVVAWLWQLFRHDLAVVVGGLPYADGRYQHSWLDPLPDDDAAGYLAWTAHPNGGEAPVGLAIVHGLADGPGQRASMMAFWTSPVLRRTGLGARLALDVIGRHPGPWAIAFQHDNTAAGSFWRRVASRAFGPQGTAWVEEQRAVPGKPDVPPDHWIETVDPTP